MKSIKPGRGPSMHGAVMCIFVALFGVFWTVAAISIGGGFLAPFGLIFIGVAIYNAVYNYKNATSKNRYSAFDIVDHTEESDPLNERYGKPLNKPDDSAKPDMQNTDGKSAFCPYCGTKVGSEFVFCNSCGKRLPK
nr:zinc ribbon domain-containing protein [Clostridia bacterium]